MMVWICGSAVPSEAFFKAGKTYNWTDITRRVCRLGKALGQTTKAGSTVSGEQRVKEIGTVLGSEFSEEYDGGTT